MDSLVEGLSYAIDDVVVDPEHVAEFSAILGAPDDVVPPSYFNVVLMGVVREFVMSGAVPHHGVVHTAEAATYKRTLRLGEVVSTTLEVTTVRRRAGAVQVVTTTTVSAPDEPEIAVVTTTIAFEEEGAAADE
ncbi:hypothetical protein GOEFS_028_00270 [Gordonia effusa NBRC 100432]|uniref:FAS1-like dehydratase domain-containing protein n=1 Tax=Gordonia effusa NBRC 100432 TaxID=1077974 RepID=H0QX12_9ACTN|nr:MaoC family dehydratase N-terminal domain-containing protein [Gordonia effusa]GAB17363.1 hypothetical protein GOEFS_028_00270 [Gordonia effusa NBRC 100432]